MPIITAISFYHWSTTLLEIFSLKTYIHLYGEVLWVVDVTVKQIAVACLQLRQQSRSLRYK